VWTLELAPEVTLAQLAARTPELSHALGRPVRIHGTTVEVTRSDVPPAALRGLLESAEWAAADGLPLALSSGLVVDLTKAPHIVAGGATGSGKSVLVHALICSLLMRHTPQDLRLALVDPKRTELTQYRGIPHLLAPIAVETDAALAVLGWLESEMDRRTELFEAAGARDITAYRRRGGQLPYIVCVVDEFADLMDSAKDAVTAYVVRLARLARATGIHLVLATQRPDVSAIPGKVKANIPTRIALQCASGTDSRCILDNDGPGAERLANPGEFLARVPGMSELTTGRTAYVSDTDVDAIAGHWRAQGVPTYVDVPTNSTYQPTNPTKAPYTPETAQNRVGRDGREVGRDAEVLFEAACEACAHAGYASVTLLRNNVKSPTGGMLSVTAAERLIERMVSEGLVSPDKTGPRGTRPWLDAAE